MIRKWLQAVQTRRMPLRRAAFTRRRQRCREGTLVRRRTQPHRCRCRFLPCRCPRQRLVRRRSLCLNHINIAGASACRALALREHACRSYAKSSVWVIARLHRSQVSTFAGSSPSQSPTNRLLQERRRGQRPVLARARRALEVPPAAKCVSRPRRLASHAGAVRRLTSYSQASGVVAHHGA